MAVTASGLREFYASEIYHSSLRELCAAFRIPLDEVVPEILFKIDQEELEAAGITIEEVRSILTDDVDAFKSYVTIKHVAISQEVDVQDYPPNESPDSQDVQEERESVHNRRASTNFLLGFLIEFWLMKNQPTKMSAYLKRLGIPGAKAYEKQLLNFYKGSRLI